MKIGLRTARPLGWAIAQHIRAHGGDIVDHLHIARGWWGTAGRDVSIHRGEPDYCLSVLWPDIIKKPALDAHPWINLHPAPLPEYRGCNSYAHAIINGETEYGVTLHYMNEGIDTGPIITSPRFPILPTDTGEHLYYRAQLHAFEMFQKVWPTLLNGLPPATVQPAEGRYYDRHSLEPYFGSPDPTVRRALTFPPFDNGYGE